MDYYAASTKEEFLASKDKFVSPEITRSCIFEVFTRDIDENEALRLITSTGMMGDMKQVLKKSVKNVVGDKGVGLMKKLFK